MSGYNAKDGVSHVQSGKCFYEFLKGQTDNGSDVSKWSIN